MLFNSISFLLFFFIFFFLHWVFFSKSAKSQNILLLLFSYFFYCSSSIVFFPILVFSSILNYLIAIGFEKYKSDKIKLVLLSLGLIQGIGLLLFFKYNNLITNVLNFTYAQISGHQSNFSLKLLIPLGISFYTFRTLGYIIDVYQEKREACKNWLVFFNYVSFFPSILAGPIDNSNTFIPQLEKKRTFNLSFAVDGCKQFAWGLFKKIVIADNCSQITTSIFENYSTQNSSTLFIGAFLFSIELYADFSGYSDMAIGIGKSIGMKITKNFNYPYFAENISDFWRRWHISLTSWLTEYVYTPLTFILRKYKKIGLIIAVLINFIISGIWHGSKKTYLVFGLLHGIYFIPSIIKGNPKKNTTQKTNFNVLLNTILTFILVMFTFIFFKCDTLDQSFLFIRNIFTSTFLSTPQIQDFTLFYLVLTAILMMLIFEWFHRKEEYGFTLSKIQNKSTRTIIIYVLSLIIIFCGSYESNQFIYFQF